MTIRPSRPQYNATVGALAGHIRASDSAQPGDPVKAGAVIIHIASLDEPPRRLLLGSDTVHLAEQNDTARIDADRKWRDVSVSTDFEPSGGSNVYPLERKSLTERPCGSRISVTSVNQRVRRPSHHAARRS